MGISKGVFRHCEPESPISQQAADFRSDRPKVLIQPASCQKNIRNSRCVSIDDDSDTCIRFWSQRLDRDPLGKLWERQCFVGEFLRGQPGETELPWVYQKVARFTCFCDGSSDLVKRYEEVCITMNRVSKTLLSGRCSKEVRSSEDAPSQLDSGPAGSVNLTA